MELVADRYKQTEVGLIPRDWEVKTLGEIFDFKNGLNKEKEFFGYGTPIVNYMDVFRNAGILKSDIQGKVFLTPQEIKNYEVKKGDVFFTRTSETVEEIGVSTVVLEDFENTVFSGFVLRGRPKNSTLELTFKKYCFASVVVRKEITSTASYTTRALTNGRLLSNVKIPVPTKAEQTAIATALSDADALISSLEKHIDKKRNIKQGAMQKLLQPKEGWEVKKLGETCSKITTGKLDANAMSEDGEYRFYTCAKNYFFINEYAFDDEALLISGNGENVGYVHYYNGKFNAYQRTYVLTGFTQNIHFIKIYLDKFLPARIDSEVNSGNTPYIKMGTLTDMKISLPSFEEQTRIATILSDMDAEIAALEGKLEKYKKVKLGMMQNLLTGRIRLV
ncbi:restriction endonuclease subunit S [Flavobacterium filum]|uniref:restriction endonuclease subunit S n=1 Tax=Flavobacterium filum TaxID=370974 RepID=UPI0023F48251|nr:restriction endonuclease subunit S [Flavobacterium filum]